jgi:hypothetical protein
LAYDRTGFDITELQVTDARAVAWPEDDFDLSHMNIRTFLVEKRRRKNNNKHITQSLRAFL